MLAGGADEPVVEERRDVVFENLLLLRAARGRKQPRRVPLAHPGDAVQEADEIAHLRVVVEILGEILDARAEKREAHPAPLLPEFAHVVVEMLGQERVVIVAVELVVPAAEKEEEVLIARQILNGRELQLEQAEMAPVQIDRGDMLRLVDQVIEDVAAAGGNRQHAALRRERERLEIDARILPNLVVNKTIEPEGEQAFGDALGAERVIVVNGAFQILGSGRIHWDGEELTKASRGWGNLPRAGLATSSISCRQLKHLDPLLAPLKNFGSLPASPAGLDFDSIAL